MAAMRFIRHTDDLKQRVRELVLQRVSMTAIGKQMGLSRSAVAGIVARNRFRWELPQAQRLTPRPRKKPVPVPVVVRKPAPSPRHIPVLPFAVPAGMVLSRKRREDGCAWIYGDMHDGGGYCNRPREQGAWCGEHFRIVYLPNMRR